jgi:hypothetical protein
LQLHIPTRPSTLTPLKDGKDCKVIYLIVAGETAEPVPEGKKSKVYCIQGGGTGGADTTEGWKKAKPNTLMYRGEVLGAQNAKVMLLDVVDAE